MERASQAKLERLCDLIDRWNPRINLLRYGSRAELWQRHIQDSLQLADYIPEKANSVGDIGSGAGMPGLVLAIDRREIAFHLIESDRRKAAFLLEAVRVLELRNVTVHACRSTDLADLEFGAVVARAVAPLTELLELAAPICAQTGCCVFPKGANAEAELTQALARWTMRVERFPSRTDPEATILRLSEIHRLGAGP